MSHTHQLVWEPDKPREPTGDPFLVWFPSVAEPVRIPAFDDEKWNKEIADLEALLIASGSPPNWDSPMSITDFGCPGSGFVTMAQIEIERRRLRRESEKWGCVCKKCGGACA